MPHTVYASILYRPVRKVSHNHSIVEISSLVEQDIIELFYGRLCIFLNTVEG